LQTAESDHRISAGTVPVAISDGILTLPTSFLRQRRSA
jgi:hypothetical protein